MLILDLDRFKEYVTRFNKDELQALLHHLAFHRILCELVIVDCLRTCDKDGNLIPKNETLVDYSRTLEGERYLINLIGRRKAARIYGIMEGRRSSIATVDFILTNDSVNYYKELLTRK